MLTRRTSTSPASAVISQPRAAGFARSRTSQSAAIEPSIRSISSNSGNATNVAEASTSARVDSDKPRLQTMTTAAAAIRLAAPCTA